MHNSEAAVSGYPDSHLSGSAVRKLSGRTATVLAAVPVIVLICWFAYLWNISSVVPSIEKHRNGKVKAEGSVKRVGVGEYVRQGRWVMYHEDGKISAEGDYDHGKKIGDWKCWDASGQAVECPESSDESRPAARSSVSTYSAS
jgi:hypothetical protein